MAILTLLTDFGLRDVYVGVMKGAIATINPALTIIDLTHDISPQDIAAARFNLMNAYPYFPGGTVHVAVVDPGVGSTRRAIALELETGYLVGPDNGLFSGVLVQHPVVAAVELTNVAYWRSPDPSYTFHGRDIFAPVGAHLASGVALTQVGRAIDPASLVDLPLPASRETAEEIAGCIQYIDHFGNLITNIKAEALSRHAAYENSWYVQIGPVTAPGQTTYAGVPTGHLVALAGSHGWIEVAVNGGDAQKQLGATVGEVVQVRFRA